MKRFFLLSTIIVSSFGMMYAQATQTEMPQVRAKKMVVKVNNVAPLEGAQFAKVNEVFVEYYKGHDDLDNQKASLSKNEYDSKLQALKAKRDAAIKAALAPDQLKQWNAYVEKEKID